MVLSIFALIQGQRQSIDYCFLRYRMQQGLSAMQPIKSSTNEQPYHHCADQKQACNPAKPEIVIGSRKMSNGFVCGKQFDTM
ncbi:MAG: hypothetical protein IPJ43_21180 [Saprospiraceae bacterium]|nr:hypothetical protein [Saprospiraceae bacterium]